MPLEVYVVLTVLWVLPAFLTASIASRKGRSFALWLVMGFLFSPGCALFMAFYLDEKPSRDLYKKYADSEDEPTNGSFGRR